jgi:hypothetical protein
MGSHRFGLDRSPRTASASRIRGSPGTRAGRYWEQSILMTHTRTSSVPVYWHRKDDVTARRYRSMLRTSLFMCACVCLVLSGCGQTERSPKAVDWNAFDWNAIPDTEVSAENINVFLSDKPMVVPFSTHRALGTLASRMPHLDSSDGPILVDTGSGSALVKFLAFELNRPQTHAGLRKIPHVPAHGVGWRYPHSPCIPEWSVHVGEARLVQQHVFVMFLAQPHASVGLLGAPLLRALSAKIDFGAGTVVFAARAKANQPVALRTVP